METEFALIAAILLANETLDEVREEISPDDFMHHVCREAYITACLLRDRGDAVDLITVQSAGHGLTFEQLIPLTNVPFSANNVKHYARVIKNAGIERRLAALSQQIIEISAERISVDEKLNRVHQKLNDIDGTKAQESPDIRTHVMAWADLMQGRMDRGGEIEGMSTGFADIDRKTSGLCGGQMIVIAARPSMGKTAFAMNIADSLVTAGKGVMVVSLEMPASQLIDRIAAARVGVNLGKIRTAKMDDSEWSRITKATCELSESNLTVIDASLMTVNHVRSQARRLKRAGKLDCVVVDYLQLMDGEGENETLIVGAISRGLKQLAMELQVPVIVLSQLNRNLEQRANKRPVMADLRQSGALEQDADVIVFLYRDEVYNPESYDKGICEAIIGKNRNGEIGMVRLTWQGEYCRFRDFEGEYIAPVVETKKKWKGGFNYADY